MAFTTFSSKQIFAMRFSQLREILLVLFTLLLSFSMNCVAGSENLDVDSLDVPYANILASLKFAIGVERNISAFLSQFVNIKDFQVKNAVDDCLDLLDYSIDELSLTISSIENPLVKMHGTSNQISNVKTWLAAALENQYTCAEELEFACKIMKNKIGGSLGQVASIIKKVLAMVTQGKSNTFPTMSKHFPSWMSSREKRLVQGSVNNIEADIVVAKDGTGNYTNITDAVLAAPKRSDRRYVIYVKKGVYQENVYIQRMKWNLMIVGDGMGLTVITGNRSNGTGWTTFSTATFAVAGVGFIARDLSFENTAGPNMHQAVAVRSDSDLSVFFRCGIKGYQDTLYARSLRQFYRECLITGTIDFIFGNGAVVLQSCTILAKKPLQDQKNVITAQGRSQSDLPTGFSFQKCNISADSDLQASLNSTYTYLGRPWRQYSRTIFMQSYIGNVVSPQGWLEWKGDLFLDTLFYAEYNNSGPGASLTNRVRWAGYHTLNESLQAYKFTVSQFIDGDLRLPSTGIPYDRT